MDFNAELARFNPDPSLSLWITDAVQTLLDQVQNDAAKARQQVTERDTELFAAKTKIQALTLELAHLRRMRFGASNEALSTEQRDLFQETLASDSAAAADELARRLLGVPASPTAPPTIRPRAGRQPLPEHLPRIEHRHEPESCICGQCGKDR
jgi:transposase